MALVRRARSESPGSCLMSTNPYAPTPAQQAAWAEQREVLRDRIGPRACRPSLLPLLLASPDRRRPGPAAPGHGRRARRGDATTPSSGCRPPGSTSARASPRVALPDAGRRRPRRPALPGRAARGDRPPRARRRARGPRGLRPPVSARAAGGALRRTLAALRASELTPSRRSGRSSRWDAGPDADLGVRRRAVVLGLRASDDLDEHVLQGLQLGDRHPESLMIVVGTARRGRGGRARARSGSPARCARPRDPADARPARRSAAA